MIKGPSFVSKAMPTLITFMCCAGLIFWENATLADVPLPNINAQNVINITDAPYNAVGDSLTTNTAAIQSAIDAAASGSLTNGLSGGTVEIPAGTFLCGPLRMKSSVNLQLDPGAILRHAPLTRVIPTKTIHLTSHFSTKVFTTSKISGRGMITDGQGIPWWLLGSVCVVRFGHA